MTPSDKLQVYLRSVSKKPFQWHTNDCFMFTNKGFHAMYGEGWADDLSGEYIDKLGKYKRYKELQEHFGYDTLEDALDDRLKRVEGIPPVGCLVTLETEGAILKKALGLSAGTKAAFLSDKGLYYVPIEEVDNAWTV